MKFAGLSLCTRCCSGFYFQYQVAALRQQIARLQSENASLKKLTSQPAIEAAEGEWWQVLEHLQQERTSMDMENARLKVQLVGLVVRHGRSTMLITISSFAVSKIRVLALRCLLQIDVGHASWRVFV
jgi:hypothetical protein